MLQELFPNKNEGGYILLDYVTFVHYSGSCKHGRNFIYQTPLLFRTAMAVCLFSRASLH